MADLLTGAGLSRLVDVRRYPGSRAHPHVSSAALARWLPETDIAYRADVRLGGRRSSRRESPETWWQVPAFRAYAAHMQTPEFLDGVADLLVDVHTDATAVMCSESLWWRCHRRLIADFLTPARGLTVSHLDHRGRLTAHRAAAGARLSPPDTLIYDACRACGRADPGAVPDAHTPTSPNSVTVPKDRCTRIVPEEGTRSSQRSVRQGKSMAGEVYVSVAELRQALVSLLGEIEKRHGTVIDLDADHYWTIGPWDSFSLDADEVPEPTVGQLSDDVRSMRDMLTESPDRTAVVWHDLTHVIGILNRLAALDLPERPQP